MYIMVHVLCLNNPIKEIGIYSFVVSKKDSMWQKDESNFLFIEWRLHFIALLLLMAFNAGWIIVCRAQ